MTVSGHSMSPIQEAHCTLPTDDVTEAATSSYMQSVLGSNLDINDSHLNLNASMNSVASSNASSSSVPLQMQIHSGGGGNSLSNIQQQPHHSSVGSSIPPPSSLAASHLITSSVSPTTSPAVYAFGPPPTYEQHMSAIELRQVTPTASVSPVASSASVTTTNMPIGGIGSNSDLSALHQLYSYQQQQTNVDANDSLPAASDVLSSSQNHFSLSSYATNTPLTATNAGFDPAKHDLMNNNSSSLATLYEKEGMSSFPMLNQLMQQKGFTKDAGIEQIQRRASQGAVDSADQQQQLPLPLSASSSLLTSHPSGSSVVSNSIAHPHLHQSNEQQQQSQILPLTSMSPTPSLQQPSSLSLSSLPSCLQQQPQLSSVTGRQPESSQSLSSSTSMSSRHNTATVSEGILSNPPLSPISESSSGVGNNLSGGNTRSVSAAVSDESVAGDSGVFEASGQR